MQKAQAPSRKRARTTTTTTTVRQNAPLARKRTGLYRALGSAKNGFPKMLQMTHRYVESVRIAAPASGTIGKYLFSCNGMYDPNRTGTGHQPMYFDQLSALYNHYTVTSSRIRVEFTLETATVQSANIFGVYIDDDATITPAVVQDFAEQSTAVCQTRSATVNVPYPVIKNSWNAKKAFGGDPLSDPNLQGTSGTDPTEQQYYAIFSCDVNTAVLNTAVWYTVFIEYTATWQELKNIISS